MSQTAEATAGGIQASDEPALQSADERQREELRMLVIGFGTGLSIAGIFLIYVILEIAHLL